MAKKANPPKRKKRTPPKPSYAEHDPHYARELKKYGEPVPSRELILSEMEKRGKPVNLATLIKTFDLDSENAQEGLRRRLMAMTRDGQVMANRKHHFALVKHIQLVRGRVIGHRDGFGFLVPDDGSDDMFLSPRQMRQLFPDDVVLSRVNHIDSRGRREATVVEVLQRNTSQVVGRLSRQDQADFVIPIAKDVTHEILIPSGKRGRAKLGQFVVVRILTQPGLHHPCTAEVIEVLGDQMSVGMEVQLAIRSYGIPHQWSDEVVRAAKALGRGVSAQDILDREDLRELPFVTIDGETSSDFDDAVCCQRLKDGWRLWVAIADVSHYVKPGSVLDEVAYERGNSVYFSNRTVPMLPEALSNGLCSIKPNVDRLAMVCEMTLSADGTLRSTAFHRAVIHSHARLTYNQVHDFLIEKKATVPKKLDPKIKTLYQLYKKLLAHRIARGALDFPSRETRVLFDNRGKIKKIVPVERLVSHRIIEECMLMANRAVAIFLSKKSAKQPVIYRVHPAPEVDRLAELRTVLKSSNLKLHGGTAPKPHHYVALLDEVKGRPDEQLIQKLVLKSLKQAIYAVSNDGHFGLAFRSYVHFTSPIRRYPDLMVHRMIKDRLDQAKQYIYSQDEVQIRASHCSTTERRADLATRDAMDWLKCEYMMDKLGNRFNGVICNVTSFGFYVRLNEVYVEGLVHVSTLKNDYYAFDPAKHQLSGRHSGQVYQLGDPVRIQVARVCLDDREIDFELL